MCKLNGVDWRLGSSSPVKCLDGGPKVLHDTSSLELECTVNLLELWGSSTEVDVRH